MATSLALLGWAGWAATAARVADRVSAGWTLQCPNTTVGSHRGAPAIRSRPGWTCDVVLRITNDGDRAVRLLRVEAPLLGSAGGAEIQGLDSGDAEVHDVDLSVGRPSGFGDIDAAWDLDLTLRGHASRTVRLAAGWRESGCNSAGYLWLDEWPSVVFETLGRTYRYSPSQRLVLRTYDDSHDEHACPS